LVCDVSTGCTRPRTRKLYIREYIVTETAVDSFARQKSFIVRVFPVWNTNMQSILQKNTRHCAASL